MHDVAAAVPHQNLAQPLLDSDTTTIRVGRDIAVGQSVQQFPLRQSKFIAKLWDVPFVGLNDRSGVMRDQPAHHVVGSKDVPQIAGAIERMEPSRSQHRRVSDVVKPGSHLYDLRLLSQNAAQFKGSITNPLRMRPTARQLLAKEPFRDALRFLDNDHHPTVRRTGWTSAPHPQKSPDGQMSEP